MTRSILWKILSVLEWPLRRRQTRLMKSRGSYTKEDFARFFEQQAVPQKILDEVWDAIVDVAVVEDFKPHPEDNLEKDFGLADEDLDEDVILALLHRCGCRVPPVEEALQWGPVDTVADLVRFLTEMSPERQAQDEPSP